MKRIPLSKGKFALVDDEDFEWLNQWKWSHHRSSRGVSEYAVRQQWLGDGKGRGVRMHRLIMGEPDGLVDHKDGCGLNNQKCNLRVVTTSQNGMNRGKTAKNASGFKGVSFHKSPWVLAKPWRTVIGVGGHRRHIGFFSTPREAAIAYNSAALKYHGEFARLNDV